MSTPEPPSPSYEELAALVVGLTSELERAQARIAELARVSIDHEILGHAVILLFSRRYL